LSLNKVVAGANGLVARLIGQDIVPVSLLKADPDRVKADQGQLEQVIVNLVINARDAMPQGGRLTIETANACLDENDVRGYPGLEPGCYVLLAVSDTGVGMDEATQAHLFEPFFTTKPVGEGTGLGLAVTLGIVKQSGGYIYVHSELGQGTTFTIYLPQIETAGLVAPRLGDDSRG
jgi:signal transduction histidine kinase